MKIENFSARYEKALEKDSDYAHANNVLKEKFGYGIVWLETYMVDDFEYCLIFGDDEVTPENSPWIADVINFLNKEYGLEFDVKYFFINQYKGDNNGNS